MLRKELIFIKKTIIFLVFICFLLPSFSVSAGQGWYFKRGEGQPLCYGGEKWVTEKGALFMGRSGDKKVYLTIDAGYGNENVRAIAKTLMETDTTAAFFILPEFGYFEEYYGKELFDARKYLRLPCSPRPSDA